jgi:hypothetical protein
MADLGMWHATYGTIANKHRAQQQAIRVLNGFDTYPSHFRLVNLLISIYINGSDLFKVWVPKQKEERVGSVNDFGTNK